MSAAPGERNAVPGFDEVKLLAFLDAIPARLPLSIVSVASCKRRPDA